VVELHLHGSVAVIAKCERLLADTGLARPAEAGEFTRRALENDKMDIAQVEGPWRSSVCGNRGTARSGMRLMQGGWGTGGRMALVPVDGAGAGGGDDRLRG
jgi:tRNA modification GTPase